MCKKEYQRPGIKVVFLAPNTILAGSRTGATGEDVPWAAKRGILDKEWDDEEYYY